ncbi:HindVP family restriction endonuclease [Spirulina sp. CS-785/01]|uniref:HindVP family restriction endonuclease n=1 Tax=Spirulina sp. CS-785/01 TaxID=3021716 RepID=UPI00232FC829|nr:HindVP family restriction endonuclease [Spirulina sp. CS-785/01]MDB9314866.1 HindVP family restriction endonuclease [Spirulina sp. CS-785/01]
MSNPQPSLFGIRYSNRDFRAKKAWGKNCFNSSFPAALSCYLYYKNLNNIYLKLNHNLNVEHSELNTQELYKIVPTSDNLFFAFETQFTPYQQYVIGTIPGMDLVTQAKNTGSCLQPIEIKLTALPDNTTCELTEDQYSCELVIRPDTIVYLACSFVASLQLKQDLLAFLMENSFPEISDWTEPSEIIPHISTMINIVDTLANALLDQQKPFLLQPVWKTQGKSPQLAEQCLDAFVWSNLAFTRLFVDASKNELRTFGQVRTIARHTRSIIWLFKMLYDFACHESFDHKRIIDTLSYNTKNDKAFAVSGKFTHRYMQGEFLTRPRISKQEIKEIILGGGQNLLSPERRFDAIIYNSPDLFNEWGG